jgi:hypothetical protein
MEAMIVAGELHKHRWIREGLDISLEFTSNLRNTPRKGRH